MKKFLSMFLVFALVMAFIPVISVSAADIVTGQWNSWGTTWEYDPGTYTLTLKGEDSSLDDHYTPVCPVEEFKNEIKHVILGEATFIGDCAFKNFSALETVKAPGAVEIGYDAFKNDTNLVSVDFSDELTKIWDNAFENTSLTEFTVPASCKFIRPGTFMNCAKLTDITILGMDTVPVRGEIEELVDDDVVYTEISGDTLGDPDIVTVHLYKGSAAERYCEKWGYKYDYLSEQGETPDLPFTDVAEGAWYYDDVLFAFENNLFSGVSDTTFAPNTVMTRGMLVTVLWRLDGKEEVEYEDIFQDVAEKDWYADAVVWASENEIVEGVGNNKFDPAGKVTREQIATIVARYAKYKGFYEEQTTDLTAFPDNGKVSEWAEEAMQWAIGVELIYGSDGNLMPRDGATRAQVAAILTRFVKNIMPE